MITTYNFPDCVSGDHCDEIEFTLTRNGVAVDITNSVIRIVTTRDVAHTTLVSPTNFEITDGPGGEFKLLEQLIDWQPDTYDVRLSITFSDGRKKTYLSGTWIIL